MINFLRKYRRDSIKAKYFKYALGEIILVVVGILIAMSINNWNELNKRDKYEALLLNEIHNALIRDKEYIDEAYLPRLEAKEASIHNLINLAGEKTSISDSTFMNLYTDLGTDFLFTFDQGPYEALKNSGLDKLTNDSLRSKFIDAYDNLFPSYKQFIDEVNLEMQKSIEQFSYDFLIEKLVKDNSGKWVITSIPNAKNVLQHASFLRVLSLEEVKAANQRRRLTLIIGIIDDLLDKTVAELAGRN